MAPSTSHLQYLPSTSSTTLSPLYHSTDHHHEPDMLAWSRLPTPIPHDRLSPPQSSSSSPRLTISTSTSTSATSANSSYALPSPLPSPLESSGSDKQSAPTSGSKTAAFFASPFKSAGPTPAPPPPPPRPLPIRSASLNSTIDASTPQPQRNDPEPTPTASRSATADFFSSNGSTSAWRPTPPPSMKSSTSSGASSSSREPSPPRLPPISRFFPSRYTSEAHRMSDDEDEHGLDYRRSSDYGGGQLEESERKFDRDHTKSGKKKLVPTSGDWETSFKRAFLSIAKKVDPLHSHSHATTSPTRERERTISPPPSLRRDASEAVSSDTVVGSPHIPSYPIASGNENAHDIEQIPHPMAVSPTALHPYPSPILDQQSHHYNAQAQYPSPPHLHVSRASHAYSSTHVPSYAFSNSHSHPLSPLHQPHLHGPHEHHAHPIRRETQHQNNMPESVPISSNAVDTNRSPTNDGGVSDLSEADEKAGPYHSGSILSAESGDEEEKQKQKGGERSSKVKLELIRPLGEGAFSSVWLARDTTGELARSHSRSLSRSRSRKHARNDSSTSNASSEPGSLVAPEILAATRVGAQRGTIGLGAGFRRKSESRAKRRSDSKQMHGIRPTASAGLGLSNNGYGTNHLDGNAEELDVNSVGNRSECSADHSVFLHELDGEGASVAAVGVTRSSSVDMFAPVDETKERNTSGGGSGKEEKNNVVAVKMMNRALCDANDRTRISFVREVEVLRHISHPSIVSYLHSFTTHTHHALILEYVSGGELFTLVNSDTEYTRVTEPAIRRMWGELARAVGWMHGVGLVHRDIKLENILLTSNIFASAGPAVLPPAHTPLVKLTDFGLSRFIDPASPMLSTRCGSEAYAAPELVLRRPFGPQGANEGYYDGRETDAWACGVVLYALATRQLPFDNPPPWYPSSNAPSRAGSLKSQNGRNARDGGGLVAGAGVDSLKEAMAQSKARREMLMRIAQCEYWWPDEAESEGYSINSSASSVYSASSDNGHDLGDRQDHERGTQVELLEPTPTTRLASPDLKRVVSRLLVRDSRKRARMLELWDEPWLLGEGAPAPPLVALRASRSTRSLRSATGGSASITTFPSAEIDGSTTAMSVVVDDGANEDEDEEFEATMEDDGMLLDEEHIDSVATQELDPA